VLQYLLKKILSIIPMLIILSVLMFIALEVTPGDPVTSMLDPEMMSGIDQELLRETLGLNKPIYVRYWKWLTELLSGNLGYSMVNGASINLMIARRLPATLELSLAALFISTVLGLSFGIYGALRRNSIEDHVLTTLGMLGISIPSFFIGLICILVFGIRLGWLPVAGRLVYGSEGFLSRIPNLIMPAMILGLALTAALMRYSRMSMLMAMNKDYVITARSKGLPEWRVNFMHGLRCALMPIILLLCFRLPMLVGGSIIVEMIFSWPGMGALYVNAITQQDYPVIMCIVLLSSTTILIASFLVEVFTALLDPKIRFEGR